MPSWYEVVAAEFEKIYGDIPQIECKGLCADACGPIDMHPWERLQIRRAGVRLPSNEAQRLEQFRDEANHYTCPALSEDERCTVYEVRPTICRLWGTFDGLRCPYNCRVLNGRELMTDMQAMEILDRARVAGTDLRPHSAEEFQRAKDAVPGLAAAFDNHMAAFRPYKSRRVPKE